MIAYAIGEELIQDNPMGSVKLKHDKRSTQQRKWKPYSPEQVQMLFQSMEQFWGKRLRNLSDERRKAVWMSVRVQAFTAMRPKEVQWLKPEDVTDRWIRVQDSKNPESDRVIPLHPEISDFPAFFHAGGLKCFETQTKDRVQSVRHNFARLTRELMDPPLDDP
jgi:integrase